MNALPGRLVLLGHPVAHSLSPRFQNAALRAAGIPLRYEALDVEPASLERVVGELRLTGAAGNVTVPHKRRVAELCDRLSDTAARSGAVNTFRVRGGEMVGENTDVEGFRALLRAAGADPSGARVAVLGAGGAASAVLAALEDARCASIALANRSLDRAQALAARHRGLVTVCESAESAVRGASIVVNATSIGMVEDADPVAVDRLDENALVIDLVYRAGRTGWVRRAEARGHRAIDGIEMLIAQGALAFRHWFDMAPDLGSMREALRA